jgi:hypothetical protein
LCRRSAGINPSKELLGCGLGRLIMHA